MTTNEAFMKEDFLTRVMYSCGFSLGLPDYRRGCSCERVRGFLYLKVAEMSLLELRDKLLRGASYGKVISIVDSMSMRFHWILEPNYDEILSWSNPEGLHLVQNAFSHWYHTGGKDLYAFSRTDEWRRRVRLAAVAVLAELFERLPEQSYSDLLLLN